MSRIFIQVNAVKNSSESLGNCSTKLLKVTNGMSSLVFDVDAKIKARRNIGSRLHSGFTRANALEKKLKSFETFVINSVEEYVRTEDRIVRKAILEGLIQETSAVKAFLEGAEKAVKKGLEELGEFASEEFAGIAKTAEEIWDGAKAGLEEIGRVAQDAWEKIDKWLDEADKWIQENKDLLIDLAIDVTILAIAVAAAVATGGAATPLVIAATSFVIANQTTKVAWDVMAIKTSIDGDREKAKELAQRNLKQVFAEAGGTVYGVAEGIDDWSGGRSFKEGFQQGYNYGKEVGEITFNIADTAANVILLRSDIQGGVKNMATKLGTEPEALTRIQKIKGGTSGIFLDNLDGNYINSGNAMKVGDRALSVPDYKGTHWSYKVPIVGDFIENGADTINSSRDAYKYWKEMAND